MSSRRQYPFHLIEAKWRQRWDEQQTFRAWNPGDAIPAEHPFAQRHGLSGETPAERLPPKFYILDMFPYPSGAGLHVGHPEGYTATDILARYQRARGFNVLHPMGWDAFGLPAEQYAITTRQHPRKTTQANVATFKRQIQSLGFSYDWTRELDTTDPNYFKWTQWIFLQIYNAWFNPKNNRAERLLHDLETIDWSHSLKEMQRNWIGRSEGAEVTFQLADAKSEISVFTTRPDTLFGATYMVLAPEHKLVAEITTPDQRPAVEG